MKLGPRKMSRLRLRRNRPLVPARRVVVLLLASFCMIAAGLPAAGRFTSGSVAVGVGEIVILALSPTLAYGMGCWAKRGVRAARRRTSTRRDERAMRSPNQPIEQIAADLRRMLRTHDGVVRTRHIATTDRRVRALEAAISTSAVQAARALEVSHPQPAPYGGLETSQLRQLLQALRAEGLVLAADVGLTQPDSRF
jgi:hypothetical protein